MCPIANDACIAHPAMQLPASLIDIQPLQGSKRLMSLTLDQVAKANGTTRDALTSSIASVVLKTIMSIQPTLAHTYHAALPASASASASSGSQEGATCAAINVEHSLPDGGHCGCPLSRYMTVRLGKIPQLEFCAQRMCIHSGAEYNAYTCRGLCTWVCCWAQRCILL